MLLAERIARQRDTGDGLLNFAARKLSLPAKNHAGGDLDVWRPMLERYSFEREWSDAIAQIVQDGDVRRRMLSRICLPHHYFWMEEKEDARRMKWGYLVNGTNDDFGVIVFLELTGRTTSVASFDIHPGAEGPIEFRWNDSPAGRAFFDDYDSPEVKLALINRAITLISVLNTPNFAAMKRHLPSMLDRRGLRRQQKGAPLFSHNTVSLILPAASRLRGEVRVEESSTGVRAHIRRGHWRLIDWPSREDPNVEAYWVWVDECEAGDEALGRIVKTRVVKMTGGSARRGFVVPEHIGTPGEKVRARRVN